MIEMLYKKKIIRDFLSLFTENYWKQLITCMLEYGIINFKKHHNIASLTPEDIIGVVENLKKDENLLDRKKSNITLDKHLKKTNKTYTNTSNLSNISNSRSKSNIRDGNKIIKSNVLLKNAQSGNIKNRINTNSNTSNSKDKSNLVTAKFNKVKTSQTPSRDDKFKSLNITGVKKIKIEKSSSSRSLKGSKNKTIQQNLKKTKDNSSTNSNHPLVKKYSYVDSDNEGVKSNRSANNIKTYTNKNKNPTQILEQIQLNKIKEKKKIQMALKQSQLQENNINNNEQTFNNDNLNIDNNLTDEEFNKPKKLSTTKLNKVQSKIKSVIENDKKIYMQMKNTSGNIVENTNTKAMNNKIKLTDTINSHSPNDKFIGDGNYLTKTTTFKNNSNDTKSSILSLEEKLNGLTQKISKVEKSSYKYNELIENNWKDQEKLSLPVKSYIDNDISSNNRISYLDNFKKSTNLENNTLSNNQDEDYITEDRIDLNKYNYLYNHNEEDDEDQGVNHNYDDLEE